MLAGRSAFKAPLTRDVRPRILSRNIAHFSKSNQMDLINPANGTVLKHDYHQDSQKEIEMKVINARKAQKSWKETPIKDRKACMTKFTQLLQAEETSLASILTSEMGKPIKQAKGEVAATRARIQFFIDNVEQHLQTSVRREGSGKLQEEVRPEPLGTIANISAWNYPFFVGSNVFAPALLTGNAVIYKPSEHVTLTGIRIAELLYKAGIPQNIFVPLLGGANVAEHILAQPIDGVFFTGSLATGKKISQQTAGKLIPTQLELGGKDPTYVAEDANVERAAKALADGAMYNSGQSCCSVERIYVHQSLYDKFLEIFLAEVKTFSMGDPMSESTYIGPLTLPSQPDFLLAQVQDAVSKGAKVLMGGKKGSLPNTFLPTVLVNVNHSMDVMRKESFGPIIGIMSVKSDEEAIQLMNDTEYGLTSGVYSQSKERAEKIMKEINSGTVYWNACDRVSPYVPWSGRKGSGVGATLGIEGIRAFLQPKAYHLVW